MRALLCPASLKGVLSAEAAAAALARGVRAAGGDAVELPIADGGEGTGGALHAALGGDWHEAVVSDPLGRPIPARWLVLPDGRAVVEAAAAIGLPLLARGERDPLVRVEPRAGRARSQLRCARRPLALLVGLGGSATVDGGAGLREVLRELPVPTTALCDVRTTLADAARLFGPQKGATAETLPVLERRLAAMDELGAVRRATRRRRGRWPRRGARGARSRARRGSSRGPRPRRLRRAARRLRPRRHGRGSGRPHDRGGQGARRGRPAVRGGRRSLRRLRRPRRSSRRRRRDGQLCQAIARTPKPISKSWDDG